MNHVLTSRPEYSRINPDSPWRWVPLYVTVPMLALLAVYGFAPEVAMRAFYWVLVPLFAVLVIAMIKIGAYDAVTIAKQEAKARGSVRVNSHPRLARTILVVGAVLLVLLFGNMLFGKYPHRESWDLWQRLLWSPMLPGTSCLLTAIGWSRPWDLKVVEREGVTT